MSTNQHLVKRLDSECFETMSIQIEVAQGQCKQYCYYPDLLIGRGQNKYFPSGRMVTIFISDSDHVKNNHVGEQGWYDSLQTATCLQCFSA